MVCKIANSGITFIVPFYNANVVDLRRCLDSIYTQLLDDDGIILVDDGSDNKDEIKHLSDEYDNRLQFLSLRFNTGVSNARNEAMRRVKTEWFSFVDADDVILPSTIAKIRKYLDGNSSDDADVVVGSIRLDGKNGSTDFSLFYDGETNARLRREIISLKTSNSKKPKSIGIAVGKFYRTEFIRKNAVKFAPKVSRSEDNIFFLDVLSYEPKIKRCPVLFYEISHNTNSVTRHYTKNLMNTFDLTLNAMEKRIDKNDKNEMAAFLARRGEYVVMSITNEFKRTNKSPLKCKKNAISKILDDEKNRTALMTYGKMVKNRQNKILPFVALRSDILLIASLYAREKIKGE